MLTDTIKEQIRNYAKSNIPNEICGLLTYSGDSTFFHPCRNVAEDKKEHFQLDSYDYLRISQDNKIVGLCHSQKSCIPSSLDVVNKIGHNIYSIIYSTDIDEFIEVTEEHLKYRNYLGREFIINNKDCFSLVRDFYKTELNIDINNYSRNDNWYKENPNIIKENYKKEGFIKVDKDKLEENDIINFKDGHFGIYLKGNLFLHHRRGCLSNIEQLNNTWKLLINEGYRYNKI